ncbi:MAG TPA: glycosyltransferase [Candidatus Koribacter sp.]
MNSISSNISGREVATELLTVTVAVPTRDRPAQLERCLRALRELEFQRFELLVANNGLGEEIIKELCSEFGARYLRVDNPGLNIARNRAALACTSDVVAYLDDDAVVEPGWLPSLLLDFKDPKVMAVTGRVDPIRTDTEAARISALFMSSLADPARRVVLDKECDDWFARANFGGVGIGCNMALRRSAWTTWGGFDARLDRGAAIAGWGEHFAFFELIDQGFRVVHTPASAVQHGEPESLEQVRSAYLRDLRAVSAYMAMLFAEFPQHRRALWDFCMARFRKSPRPWRSRVEAPRRLVPRWRSLLALISGPFRYAALRIKKGTRKHPRT